MPDLFGQDTYDGLTRTAEISACGRYRYWLRRQWRQGGNGREVCFVLLNPSTADAAAWGAWAGLRNRDHQAMELLAGKPLHCLRITKHGHPQHPLYVAGSSTRKERGEMGMITFQGDRVQVRFDRFDLEAYDLFLRCKKLPESRILFDDTCDALAWTVDAPAYLANLLGVVTPKPEKEDLPILDGLYDDQAEIVSLALAVKRYACWSGCGGGKTLIGLEVARHVIHRTGGCGLITTHPEVVDQWIEEAERFYGDTLPLLRIKSREHMRHWMEHGDGRHRLAVTNYEKWNPPSLDEQVVSEARRLAIIILDEASRLKSGGGKQKWALIKSCKGIEYKLLLTATPAPNELMEFASQASFLEKMRDQNEIIWTFFRRDEKTHRWTVKEYARDAFYQWMSGWSIYVNDPRRFGWRLSVPAPPEPVIVHHPIEPTLEQLLRVPEATADVRTGQMEMFTGAKEVNFVQALKLSQVARGFRYLRGESGAYERIRSYKPDVVADLVAMEVERGSQVLVWASFDAEGEILEEVFKVRGIPYERLHGQTKKGERVRILERFRGGQPVLMTLPSMLGWGMNFQFVTAMVFSGFDFSFEKVYQAIRRAFRHGQTESVRVYFPYVARLEDAMLDAQIRKAKQHERSVREMEDNYKRSRQALTRRVE